jgi:hypothetical protein
MDSMSIVERLRVATLNVFGLQENWPSRRDLIAKGFAEFDPHLVACRKW